jgi:hypothetical protein
MAFSDLLKDAPGSFSELLEPIQVKPRAPRVEVDTEPEDEADGDDAFEEAETSEEEDEVAKPGRHSPFKAGHRVGSLTLVRRVRHATRPAGQGFNAVRHGTQWQCLCKCGRKINVPQVYLTRDPPKSHCGCQDKKKDTLGLSDRQHELTYRSWKMMLERCYDQRHPSYSNYGGRGVTVCDQWRVKGGDGFKAFLQAVGARPSENHTLDRKDSHGHYTPDNVEWATKTQQNRYKRETLLVEDPSTGEMIAPGDLAEKLGISYHTLRHNLIKKGKWPTSANTGAFASGSSLATPPSESTPVGVSVSDEELDAIIAGEA